MSILGSAFISFAQNQPAALRNSQDYNDVWQPVEPSREARPSTFRKGTKERAVFYRTTKNLHKQTRKKVRMEGWAEGLLALFGVFVMVGGLVTGIILFIIIGWWAILIPLAAILLGLFICSIPAIVGDGKFDGLGAGIIGVLGMVVTGIAWLVWIIVMGIIELVN